MLLAADLSFSHYIELLKIDDPLERSFYEKECATEDIIDLTAVGSYEG